MREFPNPNGGVTIVDFGISINVTDGIATVYYDGAQADYFDAVKSGEVFEGLHRVELTAEQLNWLQDQKTWVERRIADDRE